MILGDSVRRIKIEQPDRVTTPERGHRPRGKVRVRRSCRRIATTQHGDRSDHPTVPRSCATWRNVPTCWSRASNRGRSTSADRVRELRVLNEGLIYCSVSAFGNVGPQTQPSGIRPCPAGARHHAHDGRARSAGGAARHRRHGLGASLWLVVGVCRALGESAHGRGARIETSSTK